MDQLRKLGQAIAAEMVTDKTGARITVAEAILRSWAESKEPTLQKAFIEYAFGKVPDKLETNPLENRKTLILNYGHEGKRLQDREGPGSSCDVDGFSRCAEIKFSTMARGVS